MVSHAPQVGPVNLQQSVACHIHKQISSSLATLIHKWCVCLCVRVCVWLMGMSTNLKVVHAH